MKVPRIGSTFVDVGLVAIVDCNARPDDVLILLVLNALVVRNRVDKRTTAERTYVLDENIFRKLSNQIINFHKNFPRVD